MSQSERQVPAPPNENRVQEVRASAHLMKLETGTFCLVNGSVKSADNTVSGVRVSTMDPADPNVTVASFRSDGWLSGGGDSALIRVLAGPAQVLVTIYQPIGSAAENAPKLRVLRLSDAASPEGTAAGIPPTAAVRRPVMVLTEPHDIIAHVQRSGDVGRSFGEWVGTPGSQMAIEGFSLTAPKQLEAGDLTYQAVLGRGWMSPWSESGQFCGSRGMALPILGLRVKLSNGAAKQFDLSYSATFLDGTKLDGLSSDDTCETPTLAALEAVRVELTPKGASKAAVTPKGEAVRAGAPKAGLVTAGTARAAAPGKATTTPTAAVKAVSKTAKGPKVLGR